MSDETTAKVPSSPATKAVGGDHDRVVMASRQADGTPDQTPDFEYIGNKDVTLAATKQQLAEQAVSARDVEERGVTSAETPEGTGDGTGELQDPSIAAAIESHDKAIEGAHAAAEAEVNARFTKDTKLGAKKPA